MRKQIVMMKKNAFAFVVSNPIQIVKPKKNGSNVWNVKLGPIKLALVANFLMFVTIVYQNTIFYFHILMHSYLLVTFVR